VWVLRPSEPAFLVPFNCSGDYAESTPLEGSADHPSHLFTQREGTVCPSFFFLLYLELK
jgi:hypothetical protein